MKPRKFERKLFLNKKTIANLNNGELRHVKGGDIPDPTNYTCLAETCVSDCPCPTEITCVSDCPCPTVFTCAVKPNPCAHH